MRDKRTEVAFTTDKHGKPLAYRFSRMQLRNFRIGYDEAKVMVATGAAVEIPYWAPRKQEAGDGR